MIMATIKHFEKNFLNYSTYPLNSKQFDDLIKTIIKLKDYVFTQDNLNIFIKCITKGKFYTSVISKIFHWDYISSEELSNFLFNKNIPTDNQLDILLSHIFTLKNYLTGSSKNILFTNLLDKYKIIPDGELLNKLYNNGYTNYELIVRKKNPSMNDVELLCTCINFLVHDTCSEKQGKEQTTNLLNELDAFLNKNKIVPSFKCYQNLLHNRKHYCPALHISLMYDIVQILLKYTTNYDGIIELVGDGMPNIILYLHDVKGQKYTDDDLKKIIKCHSYEMVDKMIESNDITITQKFILDVLDNITGNLYDIEMNQLLCKLINSSNEKLTYNVLYKTCKIGYCEPIELLIKKGINPDIKCYYIFWLGGLYQYPSQTITKIMEIFADNKISFDINCFYNYLQSSWSWDILDMLLNVLHGNGVKIDPEIIDNIASHKTVVEHLEKYNIRYDENLYKICHKYNWYPKEYMTNIKKNMNKHQLKLYNLCKKSLYYIGRHSVMLDTFINDNDDSNNSPAMYYLNKFADTYGLSMDQICLDNILSGSLSLDCAKHFMKQYPNIKVNITTLSRIREEDKRLYVAKLIRDHESPKKIDL